MIIDSLPQVRDLSPEEKWQLAEELWDELIPNVNESRDNAIEKLIESRINHYRRHPETASSWESLKERIESLRNA